jgi:hypothetical protein
MNRQIKRALGTAAALSLSLAGLVAVSAPAQAAAETTFKIHLNVPVEVARDWNIWYWNTGSPDVGPIDNTIGTKEVAGVTKDWTPNFVGEDAFGSYAEFTLPVALTALNNVLRTTESWDGQAATDAVLDDPLTLDVDEAVPAKPAIPASDKPLGGDNIFPANESWWDVNLGKRVYPEVASYKVHVNIPLKTAQEQGWNIYTWGTTVAPSLVANYEATTTKVVTSKKKVKGKWTTVKKTFVTKTKPYAGKLPTADDQNNKGWPFVGEDKYGAYAIVQTMRVYSQSAGLILRRSKGADAAWDGLQTTDFGNNKGTGLPLVGSDVYLSVGSAETYTSLPTFVGRYGATAVYANGNLTVTPVRPSHASLKGMYPSKLVVTAKKGGTTLSCTIESTATKPVLADASWALASSCSMPITAPAVGEDAQTWEVFVQAESVIGKALLGPTPAKKQIIAAG